MFKFPEKGKEEQDIFQQMEQAREKDAKWKDSKTWSLVYYANEDITNISKKAYQMFFHENGLNPFAFPSLQKFETEVLAMTADLFHGSKDTVGSLTSGGSESILMAVKAYRDYARKHRPSIKEPEMILPISVHPAFEKAAHYFGVKPVHVPLTDNFRADLDAIKENINENTVLIVGSAPCYPHGKVDPIEEMAELAKANQIPLHVDACLGGFIVPFLQKLGYEIPIFDFRLEGVTSISADVHKYGYAAKGVSTILYRNDDYRQCQYFAYSDWPGGLFVSPTATGTRPGGAIASAWAVLNYLGIEGYLQLAQKAMDTTTALLDGIRSIPELQIVGEPDATIFTFTSNEINIFALADQLELMGWHMDRQQFPSCLHFMVTPAHERIVDEFLSDLRDAVREVKTHPEKFTDGSAAMYGMVGQIPDRKQVDEYLLQTLNQLMRMNGK